MINKKMLAIFTLGLLWGPSFLFTKVAVQEIPPWTFVSLRVLVATLILVCVLQIKKTKIAHNRQLWLDCLVLGFLNNGLPLICFGYALLHTPSSLAALTNGLTPITTVLLAHFFIREEHLTWRSSVGVLLSFSGFLVLFLPSILDLSVELDSVGMILSFIAACSYGVAMVYAKKAPAVGKAPPLVVPTLQFASSLIYLIPLAFLFEPTSAVFDASLSAWGCVLGIAIFGTALAYTLYYHIVAQYGATALSSVCYFLPIFGALFGLIFLKEHIGLSFCIATILILSGVMLVNKKTA